VFGFRYLVKLYTWRRRTRFKRFKWPTT